MNPGGTTRFAKFSAAAIAWEVSPTATAKGTAYRAVKRAGEEVHALSDVLIIVRMGVILIVLVLLVNPGGIPMIALISVVRAKIRNAIGQMVFV